MEGRGIIVRWGEAASKARPNRDVGGGGNVYERKRGQIRFGDHKKLLHFIQFGQSRRNIKKLS